MAGLFLLPGCGITPMLNLPAQKENFLTGSPNPGDAFTGSWFDTKNGRTVTLAPVKAAPVRTGTVAPVKSTPVLFSITVTEKPNPEKDNTAPLPLIGFPVKYAGNPDLFFVIFADMGKVRTMARTSTLLPLMVRSCFFLVRPVIRKDGKLELSFVSWMKKENGKDIVTDPAVRAPEGGLVLNSSEELVQLIGNQRYVLTGQMLLAPENKVPQNNVSTLPDRRAAAPSDGGGGGGSGW